MEKECQLFDDNIDKINFDILILTDKVRDIRKRVRETPWYHLRSQWRIIKELVNLKKQTDDIDKRLKRIEKNPIQIVKRT